MISCIVAQVALAYNIKTTETYNIYRCQGSKQWYYFQGRVFESDGDKFKGVYNPSMNAFIVTDERKGL